MDTASTWPFAVKSEIISFASEVKGGVSGKGSCCTTNGDCELVLQNGLVLASVAEVVVALKIREEVD